MSTSRLDAHLNAISPSPISCPVCHGSHVVLYEGSIVEKDDQGLPYAAIGLLCVECHTHFAQTYRERDCSTYMDTHTYRCAAQTQTEP